MSKLLFDEQPLVIDKNLAVLIGLNEALVLQQIHYWIEINRKADKNLHEGKYWTYNTIEEWQKEFSFWSVDTVKRTLTKLRKSGILITGNFNKLKADRTLWYTINYNKIDELNRENKEKDTNNIENLPVDNMDSVDNFAEEKAVGEESVVEEAEIVEAEKPAKKTKQAQTLESPISAKCPNAENSISAKCPNALGQNAPMDQGKMPSPIPEITTEITTEISKSVSQSTGDRNIHMNKTRTDGQTEKVQQLNDKYKQTIINCEINHIDKNYREAVAHALKLLLLDIENKKIVKIGENLIPTEMVKNDLEKINIFTIEHAINKFQEASRTTEIINTVAYLKACIYNSIHEELVDIDSELRFRGII